MIPFRDLVQTSCPTRTKDPNHSLQIPLKSQGSGFRAILNWSKEHVMCSLQPLSHMRQHRAGIERLGRPTGQVGFTG